jgi:hypothetical protein
MKECGIQKHGETPRRISFMLWLKNYWVEKRKVGEYTNIRSEALKRSGNWNIFWTNSERNDT